MKIWPPCEDPEIWGIQLVNNSGISLASLPIKSVSAGWASEWADNTDGEIVLTITTNKVPDVI